MTGQASELAQHSGDWHSMPECRPAGLDLAQRAGCPRPGDKAGDLAYGPVIAARHKEPREVPATDQAIRASAATGRPAT
jgi:hypothetical protein